MVRGRTVRTPKKAAKFLAALQRTGNVSKACKAEGIARRTAYEWRAADPVFAQNWEEAVGAGLDAAEEEAYRRAVKGTLKPIYQGGKKVGTVKEYSDTLLIFLLKNGRLEKFREKFEHEHKGKLDVAHTFAELARQAADDNSDERSSAHS